MSELTDEISWGTEIELESEKTSPKESWGGGLPGVKMGEEDERVSEYVTFKRSNGKGVESRHTLLGRSGSSGNIDSSRKRKT